MMLSMDDTVTSLPAALGTLRRIGGPPPLTIVVRCRVPRHHLFSLSLSLSLSLCSAKAFRLTRPEPLIPLTTTPWRHGVCVVRRVRPLAAVLSVFQAVVLEVQLSFKKNRTFKDKRQARGSFVLKSEIE